MLTTLAALPGGDYPPTDDAAHAIAAVPNGLQTPQAVFAAIAADAGGVLNKDQARANFLQALHKEIAIAKITAYLGREPAVAANTLPTRPVAGLATALPRHNDNEYQDYINFIRNNNEYTSVGLNDFVQEMVNVKEVTAALTQINR